MLLTCWFLLKKVSRIDSPSDFGELSMTLFLFSLNRAASLHYGRVGYRDWLRGRFIFSYKFIFRVARIIPLESPDSPSVVQRASYRSSRSTQCGGYLKRAVSSRSTLRASWLKPPIGQKWPSPVWLNTFLEMLHIDWKPSFCEVANIAVLNRLKSQEWM